MKYWDPVTHEPTPTFRKPSDLTDEELRKVLERARPDRLTRFQKGCATVLKEREATS
jgi:hypothetical protein